MPCHPDRLNIEMKLLLKYFPQFRCKTGKGRVHFTGVLTSSKDNDYVIRIELPDKYPLYTPHGFILSPHPLKSYGGHSFDQSSHSMHCYDPDEEGHTQMCLYNPDLWTPNDTIYHVLLKAKFWLEAYEMHVKTHKPLDRFVKNMK